MEEFGGRGIGLIQSSETVGIAYTAEFELMVAQRIRASEEAKARLNEAVAQLRRICAHPRVVEAGFENGYTPFFGSRLCLVCRVEERPHGLGYRVLTTRPERIVSRSELYA